MVATSAQHQVLTEFFRTGKHLSYNKGEFIIRPGETPPGVFFIETGLVKCYDITKYGEENLLVIRHAGELLGMTATVTQMNRSIIYTAITPTELWLIEGKRFREFIRNNPEVALPIVDMLADMYRVNSERVLNLEYRTVRERLISFLLTHAARFGKQTKEGLLIDVPLRHQDIASSISATRETTGRALSILEDKGLLKNTSSCITLLDIDKLRTYLET